MNARDIREDLKNRLREIMRNQFFTVNDQKIEFNDDLEATVMTDDGPRKIRIRVEHL